MTAFRLNYTPFSSPQIVQNLSDHRRRTALGFKSYNGLSHWVTTTGETLDPREWAIFNEVLGEVVL